MAKPVVPVNLGPVGGRRSVGPAAAMLICYTVASAAGLALAVWGYGYFGLGIEVPARVLQGGAMLFGLAYLILVAVWVYCVLRDLRVLSGGRHFMWPGLACVLLFVPLLDLVWLPILLIWLNPLGSGRDGLPSVQGVRGAGVGLLAAVLSIPASLGTAYFGIQVATSIGHSLLTSGETKTMVVLCLFCLAIACATLVHALLAVNGYVNRYLAAVRAGIGFRVATL